jgi:hypothetical protein
MAVVFCTQNAVHNSCGERNTNMLATWMLRLHSKTPLKEKSLGLGVSSGTHVVMASSHNILDWMANRCHDPYLHRWAGKCDCFLNKLMPKQTHLVTSYQQLGCAMILRSYLCSADHLVDIGPVVKFQRI